MGKKNRNRSQVEIAKSEGFTVDNPTEAEEGADNSEALAKAASDMTDEEVEARLNGDGPAPKPKKVKELVECACQCGQLTTRRWAPGHDARLWGPAHKVKSGKMDIDTARLTVKEFKPNDFEKARANRIADAPIFVGANAS